MIDSLLDCFMCGDVYIGLSGLNIPFFGRSFLSNLDCFHPSLAADQAFAYQVWNNLQGLLLAALLGLFVLSCLITFVFVCSQQSPQVIRQCSLILIQRTSNTNVLMLPHISCNFTCDLLINCYFVICTIAGVVYVSLTSPSCPHWYLLCRFVRN
jgi:TM2 domain-containing membrane protein YozV